MVELPEQTMLEVAETEAMVDGVTVMVMEVVEVGQLGPLDTLSEYVVVTVGFATGD